MRMWGHESVVGDRTFAEIAQRRRTPPSRFEVDRILPSDPLVFLSHAVLDLEFAIRLRSALAERALTPWLAEEQIEERAPIFESVRAALVRSRAKIVALGRNGLGSAWVHTESVGSGVRLFVCDGTDAALMELRASWRPPKRGNETNYEEALLVPLETAYRRAWDARTPLQATLEESVGGASMRKLRPDKFRTTAKELLFSLGTAMPCVYPGRPSTWHGDPVLMDFDVRTEQCLRALI